MFSFHVYVDRIPLSASKDVAVFEPENLSSANRKGSRGFWKPILSLPRSCSISLGRQRLIERNMNLFVKHIDEFSCRIFLLWKQHEVQVKMCLLFCLTNCFAGHFMLY